MVTKHNTQTQTALFPPQAPVVLQSDSGKVLPAVQCHEDGSLPTGSPLGHREAQRQRPCSVGVRHLQRRAGDPYVNPHLFCPLCFSTRDCLFETLILLMLWVVSFLSSWSFQVQTTDCCWDLRKSRVVLLMYIDIFYTLSSQISMIHI